MVTKVESAAHDEETATNGKAPPVASDGQQAGAHMTEEERRAHARSGDPIQIAAYLGASETFDRAVAAFAAAYADQAERDYRAFLDAIKHGRITAATAGV